MSPNLFRSCIIALAHGAGDGITFKPFYNPAKFDLTVVMGAVSIAVLSFLGFDGISTLAEETKGGTDSVGKACVGSLLLVGALFIVQTYFAGLVFPDYTAFKDIDNAFYEVAFAAGGKTVMWICAIATGISWGIANSLAAQAAISRILYSMESGSLSFSSSADHSQLSRNFPFIRRSFTISYWSTYDWL